MTRSSSDGPTAPRVLGMDMGATHLRAGLVAADGTITEQEHIALPADTAARRRLPARIAAAHAPLDGIGFAVAGTVVDGVVTWTANLGLDGYDAAAALRQHVSGPVVVLNDARATGAEAMSALADAAEYFRQASTRCAVPAPHLLALGGGVIARSGPTPPRWAACAAGNGMRVVRSALGDAAGQIGVATLVHRPAVTRTTVDTNFRPLALELVRDGSA